LLPVEVSYLRDNGIKKSRHSLQDDPGMSSFKCDHVPGSLSLKVCDLVTSSCLQLNEIVSSLRNIQYTSNDRVFGWFSIFIY
jgi:hypothetical protein